MVCTCQAEEDSKQLRSKLEYSEEDKEATMTSLECKCVRTPDVVTIYDQWIEYSCCFFWLNACERRNTSLTFITIVGIVRLRNA